MKKTFFCKTCNMERPHSYKGKSCFLCGKPIEEIDNYEIPREGFCQYCQGDMLGIFLQRGWINIKCSELFNYCPICGRKQVW